MRLLVLIVIIICLGIFLAPQFAALGRWFSRKFFSMYLSEEQPPAPTDAEDNINSS